MEILPLGQGRAAAKNSHRQNRKTNSPVADSGRSVAYQTHRDGRQGKSCPCRASPVKRPRGVRFLGLFGNEPADDGQIANVQTTRIFKWWDYAVFTILTLTALGTGFYFFLYWVTLEAWNSHPIAFCFLTLLLVVQVAFWLFNWCLLPGMRRPISVPAQPGWRVGVITTFVQGAESLEMLRHTVEALVAMDYPHDTWVLDEGDEPGVKALCVRLGAHHFSRKGLPRYQTAEGIFKSRTKYGNVNAWLHEIGIDRYDIF